ncbi:hypothetical protein LNKW23_47810 [Paralimibaculum aggregatum]|uniref:Uncharacterized protein n=1 Tax=Paralimibaculum aggregatum TaxID=3036245 RepID=A0ABQ6LU11_9RHOB|nr:hypothetical protein [Limibaculum sp. NKW23]GMG85558.1 hypothetical protein LNKW23_47810 [Limibaculum sp. NKW23]
MSAKQEKKKAEKEASKFARPFVVHSAERSKALAGAQLADKYCNTKCELAVKSHIFWQDSIKSFEDALQKSIFGFMPLFGKTLEQQEAGKEYGGFLKSAKQELATANSILASISYNLRKWRRARSDLVKQLAALKKCLGKKGARTDKEIKEHQKAIKAESELRVWAFKQSKAMDELEKNQKVRKLAGASLSAMLAKIPPDTKGTAI